MEECPNEQLDACQILQVAYKAIEARHATLWRTSPSKVNSALQTFQTLHLSCPLLELLKHFRIFGAIVAVEALLFPLYKVHGI